MKCICQTILGPAVLNSGMTSFYLQFQEKLDKMQKEATLKAREQIMEQQKLEDEDERLFGSGSETHAPESVSFE